MTNAAEQQHSAEAEPSARTEGPISRGAKMRLSAGSARLLLELAIVFVGVSAAFIAENYRQQRADERRARQIAEAVKRDLDAYVVTTRRFVDDMSTGLASWAESNGREGTGPPFYYRIPGAERPPIGVWQAALQSQAADLLPPQLLFDLAFFYSEINGVADRYVRYNSFTEAEILPRLRLGAAAFYQEGSSQLDPIFQEHMARLDEIRAWMEESAAWAERLSAQVAAVTGE